MTFQRMSPCWPWNILPAVFSVGLLGSVASADAAQLRRWKPGWASEIQLVKFPPTSSSVAEQLPDSVRNNHLGAAHGASYRSLPGNWNSHKGWQQGREKCLNYHVQIFHAREKIWKKKKKKKVLLILSGCKICVSLIGVQWFQSRETWLLELCGELLSQTDSLLPHTCLHCTDYTHLQLKSSNRAKKGRRNVICVWNQSETSVWFEISHLLIHCNSFVFMLFERVEKVIRREKTLFLLLSHYYSRGSWNNNHHKTLRTIKKKKLSCHHLNHDSGTNVQQQQKWRKQSFDSGEQSLIRVNYFINHFS